MHEINIDRHTLPDAIEGGFLVASEPFYHIDRIADFSVLIYVTEGQIFVTEDGVDHTISSGEMLFLRSGIHHCGNRLIAQGTAWYYVHFCLSECTAEDNAVVPKKLSGLDGSGIEKMLREFTSMLSSSERKDRWKANAALYDILTECAFMQSSRRQERISDRIADYLRQNINKPFSSDMLQKRFFLSYKRMAALFKNDTGMTMQQYHNRLRMEEACILLRSTLMTVGEVSASLGFADMLYFSRCFHRYAGMSPSEYRRRTPFSG